MELQYRQGDYMVVSGLEMLERLTETEIAVGWELEVHRADSLHSRWRVGVVGASDHLRWGAGARVGASHPRVGRATLYHRIYTSKAT